MEYGIGKKSNIVTFSGVWDLALNPFAQGIKLGQRMNSVTCLINNQVFARSTYVLVKNWFIQADADDLVRYRCTFFGDWVFNDFSNTAA